ncbi:MAG: radical SAM protein, partial [Elusimicrobia bacterium]|nr:radical SAM protein [Elusimicrobiota bacterium]
ACNQKCLFCSAREGAAADAPRVIRRDIESQPDILEISGGEPTLAPDLLQWVGLARRHGIQEIILCTNGTRLENRAFVGDLVEAGITLFNFNLPSHNEKLFNALTRTTGLFQRRLAAINNTIAAGQGRWVRITFVINELNYRTARRYAAFAIERFPGLSYISFHLAKLRGRMVSRRFLVPKLSDVGAHLRAAADLCRTRGMMFVVDGIPLCFMEGFEARSIDAQQLARGLRSSYLEEKARPRRCAGCSLAALCAGPRRDYVAVHGAGELRPSRRDPREIAREILPDPKAGS